MLREYRHFAAPELDASSSAVEVRTPFMRVSVHDGRNGSTDWGVVERALPFVHRMSRTELTVVLRGRGRFDEGGRHHEIGAGMLALSDQSRRGTEAYAGRATRYLVLEWDPRVLGAGHHGHVAIARLTQASVTRLGALADTLVGVPDARVTAETTTAMLDLLRASGLAIARIEAGALRTPVDDAQRLADALGHHLSQLRAHPDIEDVGGELGWNVRLVHRRLASMVGAYGLPWPSWRALLRHYRFTSALRLLSAPGATTELVARATGFRSPSALCHAFDKAGLPSPGTFTRDARRDPLEGWLAHVARPARGAHAIALARENAL